MNDLESSYDAQLTLTFPAENEDVAEVKLDELLDYLEGEGFSVGAGSVTLEEAELDEYDEEYDESEEL
jgi:hypothetical protein